MTSPETHKALQTPRSIKYHVRRYLVQHADRFKGRMVVDFPAGNGITSSLLQELGAKPLPFDLFPEYFTAEGLSCQRANIRAGLPLPDASADALICQEGIEHFSDQFQAIKEFSRVLKPGGTLLITTPSYSNLHARISYLLTESERFHSIMPPNELDSIWMSQQAITHEVYFGHIFLLGIQKLRVLARLNGFRIKKVHFTQAKTTSMLLLPLFYPFIFLSNTLTYWKRLRKNRDYDTETKRRVYGEMYRLAISPAILVDGHLMVEFEKEQESEQVMAQLKSQHKQFGTT